VVTKRACDNIRQVITTVIEVNIEIVLKLLKHCLMLTKHLRTTDIKQLFQYCIWSLRYQGKSKKKCGKLLKFL